MEDLELAWQTFDFHITSSINKELELVKYVEKFKGNVAKISDGVTKDSERRLVVRNISLFKKLSNCTDLLINDYRKQNMILQELIDLNKHCSANGIPIPPEREVPIMYLNELKNTNATLIQQLKVQIEEFKSLLG
ncbi:MAG: hypothetical protein CMG00_07815 [Candidatus Marinimicrobia bacterium]|nr:hypothetical protein [Candidatus Neomarinimicrobiota bacterium]|tara:strand:+ start:2223 stop:2627 length:405 start_codon:yes stop_codon:yes gene_type:complete